MMTAPIEVRTRTGPSKTRGAAALAIPRRWQARPPQARRQLPETRELAVEKT